MSEVNLSLRFEPGFKVIPQYCTAHPVLRIITHNKI